MPESPPDLSPVPTSNGPGVQSPADHTADLFEIARETSIAHAQPKAAETPSELGAKMLRLVQAAETSSNQFLNFTRKTWSQSYKAFNNEHFTESKYLSKEYRARSKIFRPKTRSAVRKAQAGIRSSLFSTIDAVAIGPGNEADPNSLAAAGLMQEIVNYRLDRTSGRNSIPWFKNAIGAAQNGQLTGIVASKQEWKLQLKKVGEKPRQMAHPETGEMGDMIEVDDATGVETPLMDPVYKTMFDRPDMIVIASENIIIDSGADWTDPAQSSAFLGIKWPMKLQDIRKMESDPRNPWKKLPESALSTGKAESSSTTTQGIRTSRGGGTDPLNRSNQANEFSTIWVTEWFVRADDGEDYTFYTCGTQHLLTDPQPVEKLYPWNFGDRPITIGYASIEAHKIFPMAPAHSWQQLQAEINDLANLTLDTVKMNIAPIAKVKRGRQVELDKLRARAPGTNIMMTSLDDVEFDKPPGVDAGAWAQMERLNIDFDTLAGQFDQGSVQTNRQLNETVGGMRMISGAANALQEFDQAVFFETWAEPALAQVVRLCQYYEHDETIIGLAGERAQLHKKFGVDEITDKMLEAQITLRIDVGVGAGDPQQRIAKFSMATAAATPLLQGHKKFVSGELELNVEAILQETFGSAGYRDGGKRFLINNGPQPPQQDPAMELEKAKAKAQLEGINAKTHADQQKIQGDMAMMEKKLQIAQAELDLKRDALALKKEEMLLDAEIAKRKAALTVGTMQATAQVKDQQLRQQGEAAEHQHGLQREATDHQHKVGLEMIDHKAETAKQMAAQKAKQAAAKPAAKPAAKK